MGMFTSFVNGLANGFSGRSANGASRGTANRRIERFCQTLSWPIDEQDGETILLHFKDPLFGTRKLMIHGGDDELVLFYAFSYSSLPVERVPHEVLGYLLERNKDITLGGWKVSADEDGEARMGVKYYALGDGLSAGAFKYICETLIREATAFDEKLHKCGLLQLN